MKNNTKINIFLSLLVLFWLTASQAVVVHSLYSTQIQVADYASQTRQTAIIKGLQQVLIKVSGNSGVITLPQIQVSMDKASSMVQSYSYVEQKSTDNQKILLLQIKFNAKSVQQILRNANQTLWGKNRPLILVWLAVTDQQNNHLVNDNDPITTILKNNTKRRGLPIVLPILDLEDLNKITLNDIKTANLSAIKTASKRYGIKTILFGSVATSPDGKYQSKWSLLTNNENLIWDISGDDINQVFTTITNDVADNLATRYATLSNKALSKQVTVLVDGVNNLNTYIAVTKYLLGLTTVTKIKLLSVTPTNIKLSVTSMGGLMQLAHAIGLDRKLVKSDTDDSSDTNTDVDLFYKWVVS